MQGICLSLLNCYNISLQPLCMALPENMLYQYWFFMMDVTLSYQLNCSIIILNNLNKSALLDSIGHHWYTLPTKYLYACGQVVFWHVSSHHQYMTEYFSLLTYSLDHWAETRNRFFMKTAGANISEIRELLYFLSQ